MLGHASIKVEAGGKVIFFDLLLQENPVSSLKLNQVKKADAVCVTHGHIDHIGDSLALVKATGAPLICSPEIGMYAEKFGGIKYDEASIPLNIGGSWETDSFTITMVNAAHTRHHGGGLQKGRSSHRRLGFRGLRDRIQGRPLNYYGGEPGSSETWRSSGTSTA